MSLARPQLVIETHKLSFKQSIGSIHETDEQRDSPWPTLLKERRHRPKQHLEEPFRLKNFVGDRYPYPIGPHPYQQPPPIGKTSLLAKLKALFRNIKGPKQLNKANGAGRLTHWLKKRF